ncbi:hypothetical protein [Mycetocola manganoxydans]|uniref:hypothetical protein n=1 Tax=Mycetocola manganoxydans TaxID=699879 RepID=UPI0011C35351|nr:hypothetical protein [Mycetocola manganoxydans]
MPQEKVRDGDKIRQAKNGSQIAPGSLDRRYWQLGAGAYVVRLQYRRVPACAMPTYGASWRRDRYVHGTIRGGRR